MHQALALGRWGIDGRPATAAPKVTANGTHGAHAAALTGATAALMDELWARRVLPGRSLHSCTFRLHVSIFLRETIPRV